jgi:chromosome segregation ATPase
MKKCKELEEENETLKDNVEFLHSCLDDRDKSIAIMQEENKKLRECNKSQSEVINNVFIPQKERLEEENKKLNEKVRFLEECLDRKEKLNEEYRKELEELKSTYIYNAKQVRDIC